MYILQVVGTWVALVEVLKVIMMDGGLCNEVLCPSDPKGLVVIAEDGIGYGEIVGV
jgi:hypothetical protein